MSVWKEIRCDSFPTGDKCYSTQNEGPKGFESVTELKAIARRAGWKFTVDRALCPNCKHIKQGY